MVERLWQAYRDGQRPAALEDECRTAHDWLYLAVLALAEHDAPAAARYAAQAHRAAPNALLSAAAADYLARVERDARQRVYTEPDGFAAFIRGGGNVALYDALSTALRECYRRCRPASLLDIGVGDGLALLPALTADVGRVDLVEPSAALLSTVDAALAERGVEHRAANVTLQELAANAVEWPDDTRWQLAQATFSLHNIERSRRRELLAWLRARVDRLLIAEFDVPPGRDLEPRWFEHVTARFEAGLAEYDGDGGTVARGFLMPVMFGHFDPETVHHEQSLADWREDLAGAGFTPRTSRRLYDYWWAPGYLIESD